MTGPLASLGRSWERSLHAQNCSLATMKTYITSLHQLDQHLVANTTLTDVTEIKRSDIENFLASMRDRGLKPSTLSVRFRALQQFFKWCVDEEECEHDPTAKMKPPVVPENPVPLLSVDEMGALLKSCEGTGFVDRRDTAIVRVFLDCGLRLDEITGLTVTDVDFGYNVVTVLGKGRKIRSVPFGRKTAQVLDRYGRARAKQRGADLAAFWLDAHGNRGFGYAGMSQMLKRRAAKAGLRVHPHQLRHVMSHEFRLAGGSESDLMMLMGWTSTAMARRYGSSAAGARAREAGRRLSLGDRI